MSKGIAILGSTGSIGTNTLRVLDRQRERFRVVALTANASAEQLEAQARETDATFIGLVKPGPGWVGAGNGTGWYFFRSP